MKVNLIKYTLEPEKMVAIAARLCYSPVGVDELENEFSDEDIKKLVRFVIKSGHHSTVEHVNFTFAVEGVSRALTHQLVRHRIASYNQQSQRYVKFKDNFEYITPPSIEKDKDIRKKYNSLISSIHDLYIEMLDGGIEAEDARYILPNASETIVPVGLTA